MSESGEDNCSYFDIQSLNSAMANECNNFLIVSHNIRSFNKNSEELMYVLDRINRSIDVLVLTETWFNETNLCSVDGYNGYHSIRSNTRGGGVSVFVKCHYKSAKLDNVSVITDEVECCGVVIDLKTNKSSEKLYIYGVYRPPHLSAGESFIKFLEQNIVSSSCKDKILITGDLNIDLLAPKNFDVNIIDCFNSYNFYPLINIPTRITPHSHSCIDHIWYNCFNVSLSGVINLDVTDHCIIFTLLNVQFESEVVVKSFRDHSQHNLVELHSRFNNYFTSASFEGLSLDNYVDTISSNLQLMYNQLCPVKTKQMSIKRLSKPWITGAVKVSINNKHWLFKQFKKGLISFDYYNKYKNKLTTILKKAKRDYFAYKFRNCQGNPRKTWSLLSSITKNCKLPKSTITLNHNGALVNEPTKIANIFCEHFATIAEKLKNDIPISAVDPITYLGPSHITSFYISPSQPEEVKKLIQQLPNKGCHINDIPNVVFKLLIVPLSIIISYIFNRSISEGIFPKAFKLARIVSLFKSNDKKNVNNYRPISVIPTMSKIIEKLMAVRLRGYCNVNNILCRQQYGFREGFSTDDVVAEFVDRVVDGLNEGNSCISVFLDLSKAFDTVDHSILLKKLHQIGIRGITYKWFQSYLEYRRIYVEMGGVSSAERVLSCSVPQGSTLSPLLFLLYINDMHRASETLQFLHFADDSTVFVNGRNIADLASTVTNELTKVDKWLCANKLSLNIAKTSYLLFTNMKNIPDISINIRNIPIKRERKTKFLGVILDDRLNFNDHVEATIKKLSRALGIIYRISCFVPLMHLVTIYYSVFYCHLIYCVIVWGKSSAHNINRIKSIHRKTIKLLTPVGTIYTPQIIGLLNFDQIYEYFLLIKLFKIIHHQHYFYFREKVLSLVPTHNYLTRVDKNLFFNIPLYSLSKCQKFFFYNSIKTYNALPNEIKCNTSLITFKKCLKRFIVGCN